MSKMKIEIKHHITGKVLFACKVKNNTIKNTVETAVSRSADLGGADLSGATLGGATLGGANLGGADLSGANLDGADLHDSDLRGVDLHGADLRGAYLRGAYLGGADLGGANLGGADLIGANLIGADLHDADLHGAYMIGANLGGADLRGAYMRGADLRGADLRGAKGAELAVAKTRILPEGDIIGWKKCRDDKIVKLLIPKEAKRYHAFGRKCRAEYAQVLEIYKGNRQLKSAHSTYDDSFVYKVGKTVKPTKPFHENYTDECAAGIHFYITRIEAENHE